MDFLNTLAGQTYYYEQVPMIGILKARVSFLPIDELEAKKHLEKNEAA